MLFPLAAIFLYLVAHRNFKILNYIKSYATLSMSIIIGLGIIYFFLPAVKVNGLDVINLQSQATQLEANSRFFILERMFLEFLPLLIVVGLSLFFALKKEKKYFKKHSVIIQISVFWLFVGLSASLPILISSKQLNHYLLPSTPFITLGLTGLIAPILSEWLTQFLAHSFRKRLISGLGAGLIALSLFLLFKNQNTYNRHQDLITDVKKIGDEISENRISITNERSSDWLLIAYAMRYERLSLDYGQELNYFLVKEGEIVPPNYVEVGLGLKKYKI